MCFPYWWCTKHTKGIKCGQVMLCATLEQIWLRNSTPLLILILPKVHGILNTVILLIDKDSSTLCWTHNEAPYNSIVMHDYSRSSITPLQWRHNGHDSVSNHQPYDCLLNRLFRRKSKKTSKLRATGLCAGNSPETGEFPAQVASNSKNVSIWWRHHALWIPMIHIELLNSK